MKTLPLDAALQQAVAHHQAGRLPEAEQIYRAILQAIPYQSDANHNLGVLAGQLGQHAAGLPFLKAALEANPAQVQYTLSYAEALLATHQAKEALDVLQAALLRGFDSPVLRALLQKAEDVYLARAPSAHLSTVRQADSRVANGLCENDHTAQFAPCNASRETQPNPQIAPAQDIINQLIALFNAGLHAELERRARLLLKPYPHSGFIWKALGASLQAQGKDALPSLHRAAQLLPDDMEAHNNLGEALRSSEQPDAALAACDHALEINPDFAEAHCNRGIALQDLGRLDDAVASHLRALKIKPDLAKAHNNLGNALRDLGKLNDAVASYTQALKITPDYVKALSNLLFVHNHLDDQSFVKLLSLARRFDELVTRQARPYTAWHNLPNPERCLRVGLVSGDLRNHPVGYFLESLLAGIETDSTRRLEFIAYSNCSSADALTGRIKAGCRDWRSAVGLSDESLARLVRDDGIDILIDLSGHTAGNRLSLFAWKSAPIQASWLGYFATTGLSAMDYLIADPWTLPKTEEARFTEKILRLPETRLCFTPPDVDVSVSPLPALTNRYVTFGCFNNLAKMTDAVVALWAKVLQAVPGSRLFLKTKQLGEAATRQRTYERFSAQGISTERLILEGFSPRAEYLAAYRRVDIAIDPFPYPGGTTSAEGLWMGVPLLTLAGQRFLSRQGIGLLMNAGLSEWIAADSDDYVARAAMFAGDLQRLATLREGLRQQVLASPIFDAPRFARHFEALLRTVWKQWCKQAQSP